MPNNNVFIDTNVIIEATRINCWSALTSRYIVATVEKCIEEAFTGHTPLNSNFTTGIAYRYNPSKFDIAHLILNFPQLEGLDDGELHLLAHLNANISDIGCSFLISTADRAAVRAICTLGWSNSLISLEEILNNSGVTKTQSNNLKPHFSLKWLSEIRTKYKLENL